MKHAYSVVLFVRINVPRRLRSTGRKRNLNEWKGKSQLSATKIALRSPTAPSRSERAGERDKTKINIICSLCTRSAQYCKQAYRCECAVLFWPCFIFFCPKSESNICGVHVSSAVFAEHLLHAFDAYSDPICGRKHLTRHSECKHMFTNI